MLLIKNAHILTMESDEFESGYIIADGGIIKELGNMSDLNANDNDFDEIYDAAGAYALPGFIDAHCHVGLWADGRGKEAKDGNESSNPITPELRAIDSIDPSDCSFERALAAGVTTVVTGPGSANIIGGQFAALKTYGRWVDEMVIKAPVAMKAALGENPKNAYGAQGKAPKTRMASAALLREALFKAREYVKKLDASTAEGKSPDLDFKLEPLADVIRRKIPLKVHAHRADDICTAIRIADEFNIRLTLEHCTEGHFITPLIRDKNIPVMLGPTFGTSGKPETKNKSYEVYCEMEKAGVSFAIISDHDVLPIWELYLLASLVHKNGVSRDGTLRAITINAARNTGIDDRVGSLAVGKDADIVIQSGELLSLSTVTEAVFLNGKRMDI
ncbi:MAG: amidohydrolase family protein [Oscillospiraceae bacterium]|nr:amidohydrolase family protein [Oscillospiraceae bacterium]